MLCGYRSASFDDHMGGRAGDFDGCCLSWWRHLSGDRLVDHFFLLRFLLVFPLYKAVSE